MAKMKCFICGEPIISSHPRKPPSILDECSHAVEMHLDDVTIEASRPRTNSVVRCFCGVHLVKTRLVEHLVSHGGVERHLMDVAKRTCRRRS